MPHPALLHTAHRPWPLPARPWVLTMDWEELVFLHWRVDAELVQRALPAGVELERHAGAAWLGVVPFRMARTRVRALPPWPGAHTFPELNVRTYVRVRGVPGVWFFSLDAASRTVVAGARAVFGLPYFHARMRCERDASRVVYASERRARRDASADVAGEPLCGVPDRSRGEAAAASFAARWRAAGPFGAAPPGSLEHFLVERYCLFAQRRGELVRGDIAHAPWQLAPLELELQRCTLTRWLGIELAGPPDSALAAAPQRVAAWWPRRA